MAIICRTWATRGKSTKSIEMVMKGEADLYEVILTGVLLLIYHDYVEACKRKVFKVKRTWELVA